MEERKRRRKLCLSPVPVDQDPPASSFTPASSLSHTEDSQRADYASRQRIEGDVSDATLRRELMEMKGILNSIYQHVPNLIQEYERCKRQLKARDKQILLLLKNRTIKHTPQHDHVLPLLHALWAVSGTSGATETLVGALSVNNSGYNSSQFSGKEETDSMGHHSNDSQSSSSQSVIDDILAAIRDLMPGDDDTMSDELDKHTLETCIGLLGNICLQEDGALTIVSRNQNLFLRLCKSVEMTIMSSPAPTCTFQDGGPTQNDPLLEIFVTSLSNITSHKSCCINLVSEQQNGISLLQILTNLMLLTSNHTLTLRMSAITYALLTQDKGVFLQKCNENEDWKQTVKGLVEVMLSHNRQSVRLMGRKIEEAWREMREPHKQAPSTYHTSHKGRSSHNHTGTVRNNSNKRNRY